MKFTFWHTIILVFVNFLSIILSSSTTISLFIAIRSNEKTTQVQLNTQKHSFQIWENRRVSEVEMKRNVHFNTARGIDFFTRFGFYFLPYFFCWHYFELAHNFHYEKKICSKLFHRDAGQQRKCFILFIWLFGGASIMIFHLFSSIRYEVNDSSKKTSELE